MKQGLLAYGVEVVEAADTVTARAGLPLMVKTMRALGEAGIIKDELSIRQRAPGHNEAHMIEALILQAQARRAPVSLAPDLGISTKLDNTAFNPVLSSTHVDRSRRRTSSRRRGGTFSGRSADRRAADR